MQWRRRRRSIESTNEKKTSQKWREENRIATPIAQKYIYWKPLALLQWNWIGKFEKSRFCVCVSPTAAAAATRPVAHIRSFSCFIFRCCCYFFYCAKIKPTNDEEKEQAREGKITHSAFCRCCTNIHKISLSVYTSEFFVLCFCAHYFIFAIFDIAIRLLYGRA